MQLQPDFSGTPKQPMVTPATAAYLEALDGEEKATAKLYIHEAAQEVDEAW